MGKNYLANLMRKKKIDAFNSAMACCMEIMTVALNDEFGFGKDRLKRLEKRFNEVFVEYGLLVMDDVKYGNTKLKRRVAQIMREDVKK